MENGKIFFFFVVFLIFINSGFPSASSASVSASQELTPFFASISQNITTLHGETVRFTCLVENLQHWQQLGWLDNTNDAVAMGESVLVNSDVMAVEVTGAQSMLVIRSVTASQEGSYSCQIVGGSTGQNQINRLTVNVPPTIQSTYPPKDSELDVLQGDSIQLSCTAVGKPDPTITWKKEGTILSVGSSTFEIGRASKSNSGSYSCTAENGAGIPVEVTFLVNVQYEPTVDVSKQLINAGLGQDVEIECSFYANPLVFDMTWEHNGTKIASLQGHSMRHLANFTDNIVYDIGRDKNEKVVRAWLKIRSFRGENVGEYICWAENQIGLTYGTISINGLPSDLTITSSRNSPFSDQYTIQWSVHSESQLDRFQVIVQIEEEDYETNNLTLDYNSNTTEPVKSMEYDIQAPARIVSQFRQSAVHSQVLVLDALQPSSRYSVKIRASNYFGFTNWTESFQFETAEEGNDAPVTTTLQYTTHSPDVIGKPEYTHLQDQKPKNAASAFSSSPFCFIVCLQFLLSFSFVRIPFFISKKPHSDHVTIGFGYSFIA